MAQRILLSLNKCCMQTITLLLKVEFGFTVDFELELELVEFGFIVYCKVHKHFKMKF